MMNKLCPLIFLCLLVYYTNAQTKPTQAFGKVDIADLELKSCDFEKDANAEVLFSKTKIIFSNGVLLEHHKRIKVFNDNGKKQADIHLTFISRNNIERLYNIEAQTINLVDGNVEITKLDKKLIYSKAIDKYQSELTFTFPNVKAGSVLEYKFTQKPINIPVWYFQEEIPVRYAELTTDIPGEFDFRIIPKTRYEPQEHQVKKNQYMDSQKWVFVNVKAIPDEPYMSSFIDNFDCIVYQLVGINVGYGYGVDYSETWSRVAEILTKDEDFGKQFDRKLSDERKIIDKALTLSTTEERIAYIYNEVKNTMKWNDIDSWYTIDGVTKAWNIKTGNSTEVNIILYHLLKEAGINNVYPMVVSTRKHGKIIPLYTSLNQFNRTVVYVAAGGRNFVLDATGKYNAYQEIPEDLLNSSGIYIDKDRNDFKIVYLKRELPVKYTAYVTAQVKPNGHVEGNANISAFSYDRINAVERYKRDGEKKYIEHLSSETNGLKISSLALENLEVDSLPLVQNIKFDLALSESDGDYIYLNPDILFPLKTNPFVSENRMTNVDFAYRKTYAIIGVYKLPEGYKIEAMPKNGGIIMPDESIVFKRSAIEQDGTVLIRYTIEYKDPIYRKENYSDFHGFNKKLYEMLNEQIILKKT
jgi:hypothetical protein